MGDETLERIDAALIGLRHLWAAPSWLVDPELGRVEMSTVWVVEALATHQQRRAPATVGAVATALDVAHSTASRLVDRAERAGVVTRSRSAQDGRRVTLALTDTGLSLAGRSAAFRLRHLDRLLAGWTAADRASFARHLRRFETAVHDTPPPRGTP